MAKMRLSQVRRPRTVTGAGRHAVCGVATLFVSLMILALSSATVGAVTSWQGDDYSYDYSKTYITTCDEESDRTRVKSVADDDALGSGIDAAKDVDGNNSICATSNLEWTIHRHKTCEYRSFWPDECGNWQSN